MLPTRAVERWINMAERRVVWEVTDCYLHWLNDKSKWTGTRVVYDIVYDHKTSTITMTHKGLVPEVECTICG